MCRSCIEQKKPKCSRELLGAYLGKSKVLLMSLFKSFWKWGRLRFVVNSDECEKQEYVSIDNINRCQLKIINLIEGC